MFKNIFENKIGEKLNNFNNSSKTAIEWMDKFRQSFDISDKLNQVGTNEPNNQQTSEPSNLSSSSTAADSEARTTSPININIKSRNQSHSKKSNKKLNNETVRSVSVEATKTLKINTNNLSIDSMKSVSHFRKEESNELTINSEKNATNVPSSPNRSSSIQKEYNSNSSLSIPNSRESYQTISSGSDSFQMSRHNNLLQTDMSLDENALNVNKSCRKNSGNVNKTLVRQSTNVTSSFPLKSFQRINSQTVEIPGLNVKVVRYHIENGLGKIDPHLYMKNSSSGADSSTVVCKGMLFFSIHYNEEIQSFSVTINKSEIYATNSQENLANNNNNTTTNNTKKTTLSAPTSPSNIGKPDTYVKVQLLPDKKRKFQTRIQRKSLSPVFEETFYFPTAFKDLKYKTLYLTHFEFGRFSKHELIGAVKLNDLDSIKDLNTKDVELTRSLTPLDEVIHSSSF